MPVEPIFALLAVFVAIAYTVQTATGFGAGIVLLTLGALTMLGAQADAQVRLTVRHLLEAGATKQEIVETIGQMSMFAGIPATTRAMELVQEVLADKEGSDT